MMESGGTSKGGQGHGFVTQCQSMLGIRLINTGIDIKTRDPSTSLSRKSEILSYLSLCRTAARRHNLELVSCCLMSNDRSL